MKGCCVDCFRFRQLSELGLCRDCEYRYIEEGMEVMQNDEIVTEDEMVSGFRFFIVKEKKESSSC